MLAAEGEAERDAQRMLRRARDGDASAFEWIYRRHVGRVYAVCLRMTADPSLAEECTQRAFIRAWSALPGFRGDSLLTTWLHRIAVNEVLGCRRAAGRDMALVADAVETGPDIAPRTDTGDTMDLEQAIARLPERARHVFVLIAVHGYTHSEVAVLLGVAEGTCKAQYHRARRLLADGLDVTRGESTDA